MAGAAAPDLTDDQLTQYFHRADFDPVILSQGEKQRLVGLTAPPAATPTPKSAADDPTNFAKEFTGGVGQSLNENFGGIIRGLRAVPDVAHDLVNPEAVGATMRGMGEGMREGASNLAHTFTDPISMATGIGPQPQGTSFGNRVGRMAAGAAMVGVPAVLGDRILNPAAEQPRILQGADQFRDVEARGPRIDAPEQASRIPMAHGDVAPTAHFQPGLDWTKQDLPETAAHVEAGGPTPATPAAEPVAPSGATTHDAPATASTAVAPPDRNLGAMSPQDHVFESLMEQLHPEGEGLPAANGGPDESANASLDAYATNTAREAGKMSDEGESEASINAMMQMAAEHADAEMHPEYYEEDEPRKPDLKRQTLSEVRNSVGSEEAARDPRFVAAMKEVGIKPTPNAVADMTGTPSRQPLERTGRELDASYLDRVMDPRGSVSVAPSIEDIKSGASKVGGILQQARMASLLSGLAIPKHMINSAGAIGTAALEGHTLAPLAEAMNVPANIRSMKAGWAGHADPLGEGQAAMGNINLPGRVIGAINQPVRDILTRAGLSDQQIDRLMLQSPNPTGNNNFGQALKSTPGRILFPLQRTPFNSFAEGISPRNWDTPTKAAISAGATAAGGVIGSQTKDPKLLALAAALAGPRGIPLLAGAAFGGAGHSALEAVSPIPEWGIPSKMSDLIRLTGLEPAAIKAFGLDQPDKRAARGSRNTTGRVAR